MVQLYPYQHVNLAAPVSRICVVLGHALGVLGYASIAPHPAQYSHRKGRVALKKLNPIQEAIITHISKAEFQAVCDEMEELVCQNVELKERINFLEGQITTHAFGGWQLH
jgi:hypothetical protein